MAMTVNNLQRNQGKGSYYSAGMRQAWEDHIGQFKLKTISHLQPLNVRLVSKYRGDFYGLLTELGVKDEHQWFTLRINDLSSTADFLEDWEYVKIINVSALQDVLERYLSTKAQL